MTDEVAGLRDLYLANLQLLKQSIECSTRESYFQLGPSVSTFGCDYPVIDEFNSDAGVATGHYFHQDLLIANKIFRARPSIHLDIGSRIDGFISHLLSFEQQITIGDIRPAQIKSPYVSFIRLDLTSDSLKEISQNWGSISCLHAIEHMGLGRYGDPIDATGHYKAVRNLSNLLSPGGTLYLSHPTSFFSRIEYNAHRVISLAEIRSIFNQVGLKITSLAIVDDIGNLIPDISGEHIDYDNNYGLQYGCAIWTLERLQSKSTTSLEACTCKSVIF